MDLPSLDAACHSGFSYTRAAALALFAGAASVFATASVVAFLRPDHPLQRLLTPLTRRLAATVGLGLVVAPLELIPGAAGPVDVAGLVVLCGYWWSFIARHLLAETSPLRRRAPAAGEAG